MSPKPKDPFRIKLGKKEEASFTAWICDEIQYALEALDPIIREGGAIDQWNAAYEQARRAKDNGAWEDGADLTSYLVTDKVDGMRAKFHAAVYGQDPLFIVEGFGPSAKRAPLVEEFHQKKVEDTRFQSYCVQAFHRALIERSAFVEVYERSDVRKAKRVVCCMVERDDEGRVVLDDKNQPKPLRDKAGKLVEFTGDKTDPESAYADYEVDDVSLLPSGPAYRILDNKNFLLLPGHATDRADIYGFAKRFHRRIPDLRLREKQGYYRNIDKLGTENEREATEAQTRQGISIASSDDTRTNEKELWEIQVLTDIDGDGLEEWVVATVSLKHRVLIGLRHDDLQQTRYLKFTPCPNDRDIYGYSFTGHKLWTAFEEHTALRNEMTDKGTLSAHAPIIRKPNSMWKPSLQPLGIGRVIPGNPGDITMLQFPDVTPSTISRARECIEAAERLSGGSDVAMSGVSPQGGTPTATQVSEQSRATAIRVEEMVKNCLEPMEDGWVLMHRMWIRCLEAREEAGEDGDVPSASQLQGLESRGHNLKEFTAGDDFKFTAAMLKGKFVGKPRGSVDTADKFRLRSDFNELLNSLKGLGAMFPATMRAVFANPEAGKEFLEQALRLYGMRNWQAILGSPTQAAAAGQVPGVAAQPGAMPALPPGAPGPVPPQMLPPAPPAADMGVPQ